MTEALTALDAFAGDSEFRARFAAVKRDNKVRLANLVSRRMGIKLDPSAMFDIQIKRIHEYKRQLLNIIEAVALYDQIRSHPEARLGAARQVPGRKGSAELPQRQATSSSWPMMWPG
jgi:glucan phosphorylase